MMKRTLLPLLGLFLMCLTTYQTSAQDSTMVDPSLKGQYQLMLSKSRTLDGYKLINPYRLTSFYKSVTDTIRKERQGHIGAQTKIKEQAATIAGLNNEIKGKEASLATSNARLDQISFLGIPFDKGTYNTIVWVLIVLLAIALAIVTIRSAKSIQEAKYRSGLYEEIAQEYQTYKVKSNEKEKKLARELQDERNKLEELRTRGN